MARQIDKTKQQLIIEALTQYHQTKSVAEIANFCGVCVATVETYRKRLGLPKLDTRGRHLDWVLKPHPLVKTVKATMKDFEIIKLKVK